MNTIVEPLAKRFFLLGVLKTFVVTSASECLFALSAPLGYTTLRGTSNRYVHHTRTMPTASVAARSGTDATALDVRELTRGETFPRLQSHKRSSR